MVLHPPLLEAATHALRCAGCLFVFVGPQIVICTYFQSIGQPKIASFVSLFRQLIFLIPLLLILPIFFGLDGVWFSMPTADLLGFTSALLVLRYSLHAEDNPCEKGDPECKPPINFFVPKKYE